MALLHRILSMTVWLNFTTGASLSTTLYFVKLPGAVDSVIAVTLGGISELVFYFALVEDGTENRVVLRYISYFFFLSSDNLALSCLLFRSVGFHCVPIYMALNPHCRRVVPCFR